MIFILCIFVVLKISAQNSQISLQLLPGSINCDYTSWYDFDTINAADIILSNKTLTWSLWSFWCEDLAWDDYRVLTVHAYNLNNGFGSVISDISIKSDTNQVIDGLCVTWNNATSWTDINVENGATPQSVLVKNSTQWQICTIQSQNVLLKVEVPQSQPVWFYTADFVVIYPV